MLFGVAGNEYKDYLLHLDVFEKQNTRQLLGETVA
jgi:hypothetical protein